MISKADLEKLVAKGHIEDGDVIALRKAMFGDDHRIGADEADALFHLNDKCDGRGSAWADFFVEAVVDYTVNQCEPRGYTSQANADWLISRISRSGIVKSATELEVLLKVMDVAREVPETLERFAMDQVKHAVLSGEGVTRAGHKLEPGRIGRGEVDLLRRILYACGGGDGVAVSRHEAEMMFDLNDAVTDLENDPSWPDLFVKAVANYLMAARGYQAPSREEALRREAWLDDDKADVGRFLSSILAGGLRGVLDAYREEGPDLAARKASDIAMSETVTEDEAEWLATRIGRDGTFDVTEKALLMFIKTESPDIHPSLKPLLEKVA